MMTHPSGNKQPEKAILAAHDSNTSFPKPHSTSTGSDSGTTGELDFAAVRDMNDELTKRINELEVALLQQEHRTVRVFFNLWKYWNDKSLRSAAIWAFVSWVFSPGVMGTGVTLVSLLGLWFAWDANKKLENQNQLLKTEVTDARLVVYRTTLVNDPLDVKSIVFQPIASDTVLQEGQVYLPSVVCDMPLPINHDGSLGGIGTFSIDVRQFIEKTFRDRAKEKDKFYLLEFRIPALVLSSYVAKNQHYSDSSLYEIKIVTVLSDNNLLPTLKIDGIAFLGRVDEPKHPKEFVDSLFRQSPEPHSRSSDPSDR